MLNETFNSNGRSRLLRLPAFSTAPGLYYLTMKVANMYAIDQIYMEVKRAKLIAVIEGGSAITVSQGKVTYLDGVTSSRDPDAPDGGGISYDWSCRLGREEMVAEPSAHFTNTSCPSPLKEQILFTTTGALSLDTIGVNLGEYTIRMRVYKGTRETFTDRVINLVEGYVPTMKIKVVMNTVALHMIPSKRLGMELDCPECISLPGLSYRWTLLHKVNGIFQDMDIIPIALSDVTGESMVIKPDSFTPGDVYRARMNLDCDTCARNVYCDYEFFVNVPPVRGNCTVSPKAGWSSRTNFFISCTGFRTGGIEVGSLRYNIKTFVGNEEPVILYPGRQSVLPPLLLGQGDPANNMKRALIVEVLDDYEASVSTTLEVQVNKTEIAIGMDVDLSAELGADTLLDNPKQSTQMIQALAEYLNEKDGDLDKDAMAAMRTQLLDMLGTLLHTMDTEEGIIHIAQAFGSITTKPDQMNNEGMESVVSSLMNITGNAGKFISENSASAESIGTPILEVVFNVFAGSSSIMDKLDPDQVKLVSDEPEEEQESPGEMFYLGSRNKARLALETARQKVKAKTYAEGLIAVQQNMINALSGSVAIGEDPLTKSTDRGRTSVQKQRSDAIGGQNLGGTGELSIKMPDTFKPTSNRKKRSPNTNSVVSMKLSVTDSNPYLYGEGASEVGSAVANLSFTAVDGAPLDTGADFEMQFVNLSPPPMLKVDRKQALNPDTQMTYHRINVTVEKAAIVLEIEPPEDDPLLEIFLNKGVVPTANNYNFSKVATPTGGQKAVSMVIPENHIPGTGIYYIAVKSVANNGVSTSTDATSSNGTAANSTISPYSIAITQVNCQAWDSNSESWIIAGTLRHDVTTIPVIHCVTRPSSTVTAFGGGFISPPNMIDFSTVWAKFADIANNAAVLSTVLTILVGYVLGMILMVRMDKRDKVKWLVEELADNNPDFTYKYKISVETGISPGSGTTSNVGIILTGKSGTSYKRKLCGPSHTHFPTASVKTFIMRTPTHLNTIVKLKLWHDNSGKGGNQNWKVETVQVDDFKAKRTYMFLPHRVLGLDSIDGSSCVTLRTAKKKELNQIKYIFKKSVKEKFSDNHLWSSVVYRSVKSTFTRAQRLTVCVMTLLLTMIANAMFYETEDAATPFMIQIGPIRVTLNQLFTAACSAVVVIPVQLVVVAIFRKAGDKNAKVLNRGGIDGDLDSDLSDDSEIDYKEIIKAKMRMREGAIVEETVTPTAMSLHGLVTPRPPAAITKDDYSDIDIFADSEDDSEEDKEDSSDDGPQNTKIKDNYSDIDIFADSEDDSDEEKEDSSDEGPSDSDEVAGAPGGGLAGSTYQTMRELPRQPPRYQHPSYMPQPPSPIQVHVSRASSHTGMGSSMSQETGKWTFAPSVEGLTSSAIPEPGGSEEAYSVMDDGRPPTTAGHAWLADGTEYETEDDDVVRGRYSQQYSHYQPGGNYNYNNNNTQEGENSNNNNNKDAQDGSESAAEPEDALPGYEKSEERAETPFDDFDVMAMTDTDSDLEESGTDTDAVTLFSATDSDDFSDFSEDSYDDEAENARIKQMWPWWTSIIAWVLVALAILSSAFFIILYSVDWGAERANAWLMTFIFSFLEAFFLIDPAKVIVIALFMAFVIKQRQRSQKALDEEDVEQNLNQDDPDLMAQPLSEEEELKKRRFALLDKKANTALKELVCHVILVVVVISLSFGSHDSNANTLNNNVMNLFGNDFISDVHKMEHYLAWMEESFVPNYFVDHDITGKLLHWRERQFMADLTSYRVGPARLRQLRGLSEQCRNEDRRGVFTFKRKRLCMKDYSSLDQYEATYGLLKNKAPNDDTLYYTDNAWAYRNSSELKGVPVIGKMWTYSGGGYVAELDVNRNVSLKIIEELSNYRWVDRHTRALLLEFTIYNPNINIFAFFSIQAEFPLGGGIVRSVTTSVMRTYVLGFMSIYITICACVTGIILIGLTVMEFINMKQLRKQYFTRVKSYVNWLIVITSITLLVSFILREVVMKEVLDIMKQNPKGYTPFRRICTYDSIYKYSVAILNMLVIVKLVLLLRLTKRMGFFLAVMKYSIKPVLSFMIALIVFLMAYVSFAHCIYGTDIQEYSSLFATAETLFTLALGSFETLDTMERYAPVLTPIVFMSFVLLMNWGMLNMLISLIMDSHSELKNTPCLHPDDHLLGIMLMGRVWKKAYHGIDFSNRVEGE